MVLGARPYCTIDGKRRTAELASSRGILHFDQQPLHFLPVVSWSSSRSRHGRIAAKGRQHRFKPAVQVPVADESRDLAEMGELQAGSASASSSGLGKGDSNSSSAHVAISPFSPERRSRVFASVVTSMTS